MMSGVSYLIYNVSHLEVPDVQQALGMYWSIEFSLGRSENTFHLIQWLSMRKEILKHKKNKEDIFPKNNIAQLYFI